MNNTLTLLILFIILALTFMAIQRDREAFRGGEGGGEGGGREAARVADVNVGAVASEVGPGAASHEGLGRYGWNAFDNSVVSAAKFCHHDYDCASNHCSALGICV